MLTVHVHIDFSATGASGVAVSGTSVYIASQTSNSLSAIDVSNPASPAMVGYVSDSTNLNGANAVAVSGIFVYVASFGAGLAVIDVSSPASPAVAGSVSDRVNMDGANAVAVRGTWAYVASQISATLAVVDVSNTAAPLLTGYVRGSINLNGASGVAVSGIFVYVACKFSHSVTVVDVSSAASPVVTGSVSDITNMNGANGVSVMGNFVYVTAEKSASLTIVDVSTPASPIVVGHVRDSTYMEKASAVAIIGSRAYVASQTADLIVVFDVSISTSPQVIGHVTGSRMKGAKGLVVAGSFAYVTSYSQMAVLDISQFSKTATHHTDATWSLGACTFTTCPMFMPLSTTTSITMSWHSIYPTAATSGNLQYVQSDWNENMCPTTSHHAAISSSSTCQAAALAMGVLWHGDTTDASKPKGCMHYGLPKGNTDCSTNCGIFYNNHMLGSRSHAARAVCIVETKLEVQPGALRLALLFV